MALTRPRALQIFDLDYKQAVRAVTTTNVTLSGGAPATVDGVALAVKDRILVNGQGTASQNGIYEVDTLGTGVNGTWVRTIDAAVNGTLNAGAIVMVTEGTVFADTQFKLLTDDPIVIGSTPLNFEQNSAFAFGNIFANGTAVLANSVGDTLALSNGNNISITGNASSKSVTVAVVESPSFSGTLAVTGNITGGNLTTAGITNTNTLVATGNVSGGNIVTVGETATGTFKSTGDALINGNLIVQGNLTYINIDDLRVQDPVIILGTGPNGAPLTTNDGLDRGVYMEYFTTDTANAFVGFQNATGNMIIANDVEFLSNDIVQVNSFGTLQAGNAHLESAEVVGNIIGGNISTSGTLSTTGNLSANNLSATNSITAGTTIDATGNVSGGNITTVGEVTATGNVSGGNVITSGTVSSDLLTATGNITGGNLITVGSVTATGNVSGDFFIGNGSQLTGIDTTLISNGNSEVRVFENSNVAFTVGGVANVVLVTTTGITVAGNVDSNNVNTTAVSSTTIDATGNVSGGNINTAGQVVATGNITGGNVSGTSLTGTLLTASQPNITEVGTLASLSVTGNVDAGNVSGTSLTGTLLTANQPNITDVGTLNNLTVAGNVIASTATIGNITISDSNINSDAVAITINSDSSDVDFVVNGDTTANIFYVDAGTETVSIGNSTQTPGATLAINSTDSLLVPRGTTAQRPDPDAIGMVRFNTENDGLEVFTLGGWKPVGVEFTVIASETFAGDNSTVVFTLATEQTTNSCIISINGIVQEPTVAYAVSGTTLTFTEAPLDGDTIEVRALTTTTTVVAISNATANAVIAVSETSNSVNITGDLIPTANVTFDLGSTTARWNELYLAGNTIVLGDLVIKNTGGNTIGFFGPDGTTPGTIDTTNIDSAGISNGTSSLTVVDSGGNIQANIADSTVGVFSSTGLVVTGSIEATNGFIGLDATAIANGSANVRTFENANVTVSAGGNANVLVVTGTGANILGTLDVTGDTLISGNLTVSGTTFTANVTTLTITDPVIALGSGANGASLVSNDGLDRGIKMFYFTDAEQTAFVGFDNSEGKIISAANVTVANNIVTVNSLGTTTVGVLETSEIVKTGANAVGNIGQSNNTFDTVFAQATSSLYADLAEQYLADDKYGPGTVLVFGGSAEVTSTTADADHRVAGVVSTNPGYIMNAGLTGEHVVLVALTGRVPCQVIGPVSKGDLMVSAADGHARADNSAQAGTIIGKALEDFAGESGVIEVVVGKH